MKKLIIVVITLTTILIPLTVNAQETAKDTLIKNVTTTNDGLYKDEYEEGRYIYRGQNPNNYITFNNETAGWRILSIETDGTIKIIKTNSIGEMVFNEPEIDRGTYCDEWEHVGCNAWAKMDYFSSPTKSGTVTKDADINTYLNTTYYDTLSRKAKEIILDYNFNIGGTTNDFDMKNINQMIQDEKEYTWEGKVGLIYITDFMKTIIGEKTTWIKEGYSITPNHTISTSQTPAVLMTMFSKYDDIELMYTDHLEDIYPVVNLDPYIKLSGTGTIDDPYTITNPVKVKFETFGDLEKELIYRLETTGKTLEEIKEEINNQIGTEVEQDGKVCTLDSWYLDRELKTKFDEETPINNNLTLFGRWECRETVDVPDTLLQIPRSIITIGCGIIILGIGIVLWIIRKKYKINGGIK